MVRPAQRRSEGMLGTLLGGYLADRFGAINRRHVLSAPAIGMALAVPTGARRLPGTKLAAGAWPAVHTHRIQFLLLRPDLFGGARPRAPCPCAGDRGGDIVVLPEPHRGWGLGRCSSGCCPTCCSPPMAGKACVMCFMARRFWDWVPAFFFWRCGLRLNEGAGPEGVIGSAGR